MTASNMTGQLMFSPSCHHLSDVRLTGCFPKKLSANMDVAMTPLVTGEGVASTEQARRVWNGNGKYCFVFKNIFLCFV